MKKTIPILVMAMLWLNFNQKTNAQAPQTTFHPIHVGDKIPKAIWDKKFNVINHPEGKKTIQLKEYRNKLIILDFWSSNCHPCIESLDHLDSIQNEFKNDLVVVPVNVYDFEKHAVPFMKKKNWPWPSISSDTVLNKIMLLPYLTGYGIAWIKDGKLLAVPALSSKQQLTPENIRKVLLGEKVFLINRKGYID